MAQPFGPPLVRTGVRLGLGARVSPVAQFSAAALSCSRSCSQGGGVFSEAALGPAAPRPTQRTQRGGHVMR